MTDIKHTPGPWLYRPQPFDDWGTVRAAKNADGIFPFICQAKNPNATLFDDDVLKRHRENGSDPWEANARLISLAPEMSRVLREIRYIEENRSPFGGEIWQDRVNRAWWDLGKLCDELYELL